MVDFVYDKSKQEFSGRGQNWKVRSGLPGRYQPTPNGLYTLPKNALMSGKSGFGVPHDGKYAKPPYSFSDKKGFSWFLWLGKANLGIHPDGNVPGTEGCIGILGDDTSNLFNKLKTMKQKQIVVLVK